MMSKQLVTVALLVTLAAVAVNATSLTAGSRKPGDSEALAAPVFIKGKAVPGKSIVMIRSVNVSPKTITEVFAQDLDNKGASARIASGGPGSESASIYFQSPNGVGLNYLLHVYAK